MGYENSAGLNVHNHYGARNTGGAVGQEHRKDSEVRLRIELTGQSITDAIAAGGFVPPVVLPKGAHFKSAFLQVDEAFVLGGTTPALSIGPAASIGTNYFSLSEAELEATGAKTPAAVGAGTMAFASATGIATADKIAIDLTGTLPTIDATVGKATLVLEYDFLAK